MRKLLLMFLLVPLVCFAGGSRFINTDGNEVKLKRVSKEEINRVKIYLAEKEVPDTAQRIGIILCDIKWQDDAIRDCRKLAARAGGGAMLLQSGKEITGGERMANAWVPGARFKSKWVFYVYR